MSKEYIITHQRKIFNTEGDRSTVGEIFPDGEFIGYSVEDEFRPDGVKVFGKTCIPAIRYRAIVTMSPKFKRKTILLYNQPDYSIKHNGVTFTGVRVHKGATALHSHGCPCVGDGTDGVKIWDSKSGGTTVEEKLTALVESKIKEGYTVYWDIQMKPFQAELNNKLV